jgi:hypothetical protein
MKIDLDVRGVTSFFGLDSELLQPVVLTEGDIVGAVRRRYPTAQTREEALKVVARSGVRAMCHWISLGGDERRLAFVANWAKWWTFPGGAALWSNTVLRELSAATPSSAACQSTPLVLSRLRSTEQILEPEQPDFVRLPWICAWVNRPKHAATLCIEATGGHVDVLSFDPELLTTT